MRENIRGARTLTNDYLVERKINPPKPMDTQVYGVFVVVAALILGATFWPVVKALLTDFTLGFLAGTFTTIIVLIGLLCIGVMVGVQRIPTHD